MSQQHELNNEKGVADIPLKNLLYLSIVILVIQAIFGYLIYVAFGRWEDRASFGSMFGAASSLFSGWAFAGVIYAILLQRRDLEIQRKELEMTREELKRSAEAQERSEQALLEQAKMMELTAKLTAKNFLAEVYRNRMEFLSNQGRENQKERNKWSEIIFDLEDLTRQIDK